MKRAVALFLCLVLLVMLALPVAAATPQNGAIHTAVSAVQKSVGVDTPGAAVLLFENGERVLFEGYGYADIEKGSLVTAQTAFEIGSLSSVFVALAVEKLAEEGLLDTGRDVAYYLPGDFQKALNLKHPITVENLLAGRAGFSQRRFDLRHDSPSLCFDSLREALLADVPEQIVSPDTYTLYSPFSVALAAFVVECVSQMPYEAYVEEAILKPLGMSHTVLNSAQVQTELANGHVAVGNASFGIAANGGRSYSTLYPADGAISDIADLSILLSFLLRDDVGQTVLPVKARAAALEKFFLNGIFATGNVGFSVDGNVRALTAQTAAFSASLAFDRTAGKAALVLVNVAQSALLELPWRICDFTEGVGVVPEQRRDALEIFVGTYVSQNTASDSMISRNAQRVRVTIDGEKLLVDDCAYVQVARGVFAKAESNGNMAMLQFVLSVEGEVLYLLTASGEMLRRTNFWDDEVVQGILMVLFLLGIFYFSTGAVLYVFDAVSARKNKQEDPRPWRSVVPWLFSAVLAITALLRLIAISFGGSAVASFFRGNAVLSIGAAILALASFVFAFVSSFGTPNKIARVARSVAIFFVFALLCVFWDVLTF